MARRAPLIQPGSVLPAAGGEESVMDDVIGQHKRRKGIEQEELEEAPPPPVEETEVSNLLESQNSNELERKISDKKESLNSNNLSNKLDAVPEDLVQKAIEASRTDGDLAPWGTRLPKPLKKRLDYQAYRLKDRKVTGQGITLLALELLLTQLEAQEQEEIEEA